MEGFEIHLRYLTREDLMKVRNKALTYKFNKRTRQREEEVDNEKFLEAYRSFEKSGGALLSAIAIHLELGENYFDEHIHLGNSILIIEHNSEVIKCADWVIDLGPEGGDEGGYVLFEGTPDDLVSCKESHTGKYLKDKLGVKHSI